MLPTEWKMCILCLRVNLNPMTWVILYICLEIPSMTCIKRFFFKQNTIIRAKRDDITTRGREGRRGVV